MRRGEVRWYKFSKPDKRRPVLILTRDSALDYLGEVTIAPITTRLREIPSQVVVTRQEGMPRDSAISLDHVQTISKSKLGSLIMTLAPGKLVQVEKALMFALGFRIA
jgi:mRNA interferase MazF